MGRDSASRFGSNGSSTSPPGAGAERTAGPLAPVDRDRILQAMAECCAGRGYAETTIAEVLERADVSRERFDALFDGKEDCALAAIDMVMSEALATVGSIDYPSDVELRRGIVAARELLGLMSHHSPYSSLALIEARQGGTAAMRERYEYGFRMLALMAERARGMGPERPSAVSDPRIAIGGVEAVVRREISAGRYDRLPGLLPDFVYGVLTPLIGQEAALRQAEIASDLVAESHE